MDVLTMNDVHRIRSRQEQRLTEPHQAMLQARKHLESAIALVEAREREYRELQNDVQGKLDALDVVASLASGTNSQPIPAALRVHGLGVHGLGVHSKSGASCAAAGIGPIDLPRQLVDERTSKGMRVVIRVSWPMIFFKLPHFEKDNRLVRDNRHSALSILQSA